MRYSLDGNENVTISGNSTITNLTNGSHNVTLYVKDTFGNIAASKIVIFSIATTTLGTQESFPTVPVIAVSGVSLTVIAIGLMAYFKKRKH